MVPRGRAPKICAIVRRTSAALSLRAALALALLTISLTACAWSVTASAAGLPPVQIAYSGTMSVEVFPTAGKPAHSLRTLAWKASANSGGSDGPLALDFSSVSGSASVTGNGNCHDATTTLSLASARNPVSAAWTLTESSDFPSKGWNYVAPGAPSMIPVLESLRGACGSSFDAEELLQPEEMLLKQETFSPAQLKEYEAIFDPLELSPGKPASRTRTFSFDGTSHCSCLPEATHVKESMSLTVSATSPAPGNTIKTEPRPGGGGGPGSKGSAPARKKSEARRKELKEQARADLGPALEEAWKAHGLSTVIGLNYGVALSTALDELGQQGALIASNDATARVINDYRIVNDPPDRRYRRLAQPRRSSPPRLPSCGSVSSAERPACTSLRAAENTMLAEAARASAITAALLVTIDRDSGAIRARDYGAAQRQFVHFESLHRDLKRVLAKKGAAGGRVAAALRGLGVSGALSGAQAAAAVGAVEAKLASARVPAAKLGSLARGALEAREADGLEALAATAG